MVPLGTLVHVQNVTGPDRIVRYDMYPAAEITGNPGAGRQFRRSDRANGKVGAGKAAAQHRV